MLRKGRRELARLNGIPSIYKRHKRFIKLFTKPTVRVDIDVTTILSVRDLVPQLTAQREVAKAHVFYHCLIYIFGHFFSWSHLQGLYLVSILPWNKRQKHLHPRKDSCSPSRNYPDIIQPEVIYSAQGLCS